MATYIAPSPRPPISKQRAGERDRRTPRCVDEFVTITRVFLDLLNTTSTTALKSSSHFNLPVFSSIQKSVGGRVKGYGECERELLRILQIFHADLHGRVDEPSNFQLECIFVDIRDAAMVPDAKWHIGQLTSPEPECLKGFTHKWSLFPVILPFIKVSRLVSPL